MIVGDQSRMSSEQRQLYLRNDDLLCRIVLEEHIVLDTLLDRRQDRSLVRTFAPLIHLEAQGQSLEPASVEVVNDTTLHCRWSSTETPFQAEVHIRLDGARLQWTLDLGGEETPVRFRFPFLAQVCASTGSPSATFIDERSFCNPSGKPIFRRADWPLPKVWLGQDNDAVTLLGGPSEHGTSMSIDAWATEGLEILAPSEGRTVWNAELIVHEGGWPEAWQLFRQRVRAGFNLEQYQRPDLAWYNDQLVHHFTFLYGREILNLDTGEFEIERFLDEGEHLFGGYDGMLIWGVYPRIGVDERTQWDFHDDFPGGREGLRAMAQRARERGVRFFVPYKPWDRAADIRGDVVAAPDHEELARLVVDVDADGVFLDTMSAVSPEFRDALDQARPGTVFCSEGRAKGDAFELITGSWDQWPTRDTPQGNWSAEPETMPGVDVWRFVFPEHRLFVIDRHATALDRWRVIQRGFFSGMGWVVWQDIFGLVLPYTPDEAALLKRCRTILREHRQALWSMEPTPLIITSHPQVYCNEFASATKRLWTLYNATDAAVEIRLPHLIPRAGCHFIDLWNDQEVSTDEHSAPSLTIAAHAVSALAELPCLLSMTSDGREVIVRDTIPGAYMEARQRRSTAAIPLNDSGRVDLSPARTNLQPATTVRLLLEGEVLDQIVVERSTFEER